MHRLSNDYLMANALDYFTAATEALVKANPVNICSYKEDSDNYYSCPRCRHIFVLKRTGFSYCPDCGQKLRWE